MHRSLATASKGDEWMELTGDLGDITLGNPRVPVVDKRIPGGVVILVLTERPFVLNCQLAWSRCCAVRDTHDDSVVAGVFKQRRRCDH